MILISPGTVLILAPDWSRRPLTVYEIISKVSDPSMASISKDSMIKVKVYTCKDDAIHQCLGKGQLILSSEMDIVVLSEEDG